MIGLFLGETDFPNLILNNIKKIIKIYTNTGAKVVYIIPYPPTPELNLFTGGALIPLYENWKMKIKSDPKIDYISLEDFDDSLRKGPSTPYATGIPEPTKKGAFELARRIFSKAENLFPVKSASRKPKRKKIYKFRVKSIKKSAFDKLQEARRRKMLGLTKPKLKKTHTLSDAMKKLSLKKKTKKTVQKFDLSAAFTNMSVKSPKISQKKD